MTKRLFNPLISLGRHCQCAYQIRRFTQDTYTSYFDWVGAPFHGLLDVLSTSFHNTFERADLAVSADGTHVKHLRTGFIYRHLFSRLPGTEMVDPGALDREYVEKRSKMDYLGRKFLSQVREQASLYVRHDDLSLDEAHLLLQALDQVSGAEQNHLLIVSSKPEAWTTDHPRIQAHAGVPMSSGPNDWKGDNTLWDIVLRPYGELQAQPGPGEINDLASARMEAPPPDRSRVKTKAKKRLTVLFQVPNEIGLGHISRQASVALALREMAPAVRVVFAIAGDSHGLLDAYSLPYLALPVARKMTLAAGWNNWLQAERRALVEGISESIVRTIEPDLVVFDCFPHPHIVDLAIAFDIKTVLCLRNMKDFASYQQDLTVRRLLDSCRSIISPHTEGESRLPLEWRSRALFSGPIVKPLPIDPMPVQLRLTLPNKRVIVITAGGGGHVDTKAFLEICLMAVAVAHAQCDDIAAVLIPGPLFKAWDALTLKAGMELRVLPFDARFSEICATADLVLAQAGYNSATELALLGTPTLLIPAHRGFDDQFERAKQMAVTWDNVHTIAEISPSLIAQRIIELLATPLTRIRQDSPDGAYGAAAHLVRILTEEST